MNGTRTQILPLVLKAIAAGGTCHRDDIASRAGITKVQAIHGVNNAVNGGYIEPTGQVVDRQNCWQLTALGRVRLDEIQRVLPGATPPPDAAALADQALALIAKSAAGLDTEHLAQKLGASLAEVDAALAPIVAERRLVTCGLLRGENKLTLYRSSTGGTGEDWRAHGSLGFHSGMTAQQVQAEQAEKAAQAAAAKTRKPLPAPRPAPAPAWVPGAPPEVACEVLDPAPATPPAPPVVPFVGELDIDAIHHQAPAPTPAPMAPQPAPQAAPQTPAPTPPQTANKEPADRFMCALYSNGALLIDSGHEIVTLPLAHTRRLLHYLEHLGAAALLGDMP